MFGACLTLTRAAEAANNRSPAEPQTHCALPTLETMTALSFFLAWLANPRRIGAIAPSSAALANAITADLTPASAPVIELGPGTGVFTRSIIARGVPEHRLALIEYAADFVDKLRHAHMCTEWTRRTCGMSNCSMASARARS